VRNVLLVAMAAASMMILGGCQQDTLPTSPEARASHESVKYNVSFQIEGKQVSFGDTTGFDSWSDARSAQLLENRGRPMGSKLYYIDPKNPPAIRLEITNAKKWNVEEVTLYIDTQDINEEPRFYNSIQAKEGSVPDYKMRQVQWATSSKSAIFELSALSVQGIARTSRFKALHIIPHFSEVAGDVGKSPFPGFRSWEIPVVDIQ